jgi:LPS-assembly protein
VRQRRYFDPNFGGAVVSGARNVLLSASELTAHAFFDQARNYSPVVNTLRAQPLDRVGIEWRGDYDPLRGRFTNTSVTADARFTSVWVNLGHNKVSCVPLVWVDPSQRDTFCSSAPSGELLAPASNQMRGTVGWGGENRRGWNVAMSGIYNYSTGILGYANTQVTYNTSCCAFSGQFRRFNIGTRNESQYRLALVIANIGSFGTLKRQDRIF